MCFKSLYENHQKPYFNELVLFRFKNSQKLQKTLF